MNIQQKERETAAKDWDCEEDVLVRCYKCGQLVPEYVTKQYSATVYICEGCE